MIPKVFARVTKHKSPKYQLYQPGFVLHASCWTEGGWLTVSKEEYDSRVESHLKMYSGLEFYLRNGTTLEENLTPAQKQAWEYSSGETTLTCTYRGKVVLFGAPLAGNKITKKVITYLREKDLRVPSHFLEAGNFVVDQTILGVPEDLIDHLETPFDKWREIVTDNKAKNDEMIRIYLDPTKELDDFQRGMGCQFLLEVEQEIIHEEHNLSLGKTPDPYTNLEEERVRYTELRRLIEGTSLFRIYEEVKRSANECARFNLDSSDGQCFDFVIPTFYSDGSHDPWGPKDVPWGNEPPSEED